MRYLIVLDGSEPGVGYDVTVPDLPGCTSAGDTLGEAVNHAPGPSAGPRRPRAAPTYIEREAARK